MARHLRSGRPRRVPRPSRPAYRLFLHTSRADCKISPRYLSGGDLAYVQLGKVEPTLLFTSGRKPIAGGKGFKDKRILYDAGPQPYGELFVMRPDGSEVAQLTDNQWEDAAPAWRPEPPAAARQAAPPMAGHEPRSANKHRLEPRCSPTKRVWNSPNTSLLQPRRPQFPRPEIEL